MSASACPRCGGTGFQIVERDGREFAQPCDCRRAGGGAAPDVLDACRIPPRYEHCTLASFEGGSEALDAALSKVKNYCEGYPFLGGGDEGLGLLFTGGNGVGKTHLAVGALRELAAAKGARGQFWDFHELIREIKNSYNPETRTTELQVLSPVVDADILVLDDLGAWKMTDWMLDTLFFVLNSRYMAKRATLITTNFPDASPEAAARDQSLRRKEYLVERVGTRVRSRLMEMCVIVEMHGTDWRQNRQAGNQTLVGGPPRPARR